MKTNLTVSEILDWQSRAVIEATLEVIGYGKNPKVVVTEKLINKHKAEAERQINELLREARIKSYETSLSDIEAIVTLQGPNIKATDAMRLIYDRLAHLKETEVKDE